MPASGRRGRRRSGGLSGTRHDRLPSRRPPLQEVLRCRQRSGHGTGRSGIAGNSRCLGLCSAAGGRDRQLRRPGVQRPSDRYLRQNFPSQLWRFRRGALFRQGQRVPGIRDRRRASRHQCLRGYLVRGGAVIGAAAGWGGADSQYQRLAVPCRQERFPQAQHRRQPRRRKRTFRSVPQHGGRTGRTGLRWQQHDLRPVGADCGHGTSVPRSPGLRGFGY